MTRGATLDLRRAIKRCAACGQQFSPDAAFCPFDGEKLESAAWDPSADALVGKVLDGRYEVQSVLGEGGMGKVYKVRHTSLDRPFALKALKRELARDEELAQRFIQEAKTTAAIHHPNIVSISDFGKLDDESPFYVMELLVGKTLSEIIKAGGPIPAGRAVRVLRQIAAALGAAHAKGIVHRDLKPENVFLVGGMSGAVASDEVRVVDFGAAKVMGSSRLTRTGIVFGTPHYMSPEQASGQPVDHRADIYALGIIMYEMFTGRVPFEADTYMGVLTQHMFVQPVPPSQVCAAARELGALEDVTLKALEKKPEDRYQTMEELAQDIDRVVRISHGSVEIAPASGAAARPRKSQAPPRYKMADELEPPTLEEMRVALDTTPPPKRRGAVVAALAVAAAALAIGVAAIVLAPSRAGEGARAAGASASVAPPKPSVAIPPPRAVGSSSAEQAASAPPVEDAAAPKKPAAAVTSRPSTQAPQAQPKPRPRCDPDDPFCR